MKSAESISRFYRTFNSRLLSMGNNNSRKPETGVVARLPQGRHQSIQPSSRFQFTRPTTSVIGVSKYVPTEPVVPPFRLPVDRPTIEVPPTYEIFKKNYYPGRVKPEEFEALTSRISSNSDELRRQNELAEKSRFNRYRVTNKIFTSERETLTKPQVTINSFMPINRVLDVIRKHDQKYFPTEPKLPELTPEILDVINEASRPQPYEELLVKIDDVEILRKDIQTLRKLNWLNDEIINAYMLLLVHRGQKPGNKKVYAFNTFFYPKLRENGYSSIRRWTRKVDIFSHDFVLVPVHLGNHWCLAMIDFTTRIISYYDSLGGFPNGCCDTLLEYLREESRDKKKQDFDDENWRLVNSYSEGIPQQKNCSDCGVFACTYAEYLTRQAKLTFSQEQMPYFRKKMIYEIITRQILE